MYAQDNNTLPVWIILSQAHHHISINSQPFLVGIVSMTTRWPNPVFCFLLAVTVVNVQNAGVYFCGLPKVDALTARKLIAQQLIENKYLHVVVEEQVAK